MTIDRQPIQAPFDFGSRVIIDGDKSLVATVTAFQFRVNYVLVEISWVHNGESKTAWVEGWRLKQIG